jgi:hypothetical protein
MRVVGCRDKGTINLVENKADILGQDGFMPQLDAKDLARVTTGSTMATRCTRSLAKIAGKCDCREILPAPQGDTETIKSHVAPPLLKCELQIGSATTCKMAVASANAAHEIASGDSTQPCGGYGYANAFSLKTPAEPVLLPRTVRTNVSNSSGQPDT